MRVDMCILRGSDFEMAAKIMIGGYREKVNKCRMLFESSYHDNEVEFVEFSEMSMCIQSESQVAIILLCIDRLRDLIQYLLMRDKYDRSKNILIISDQVIFANLLTYFLKDKVIRCRRSLEVIAGFLEAITRIRIMGINCSDLLNVCKDGMVWYQCCTGSKEMVLYKILKEWNAKRKRNCCLINIVGDVTLQDASDICGLISVTDDVRLGVTYDEREKIRVFSLWRTEKE